MSYDRAMIEAAIRNGGSIEPGEAAALLGTIDRLSAELRDARADLRVAGRNAAERNRVTERPTQ